MERARYEYDLALRETHPEVRRMLRDDVRFALKAVRIRFRRLAREAKPPKSVRNYRAAVS